MFKCTLAGLVCLLSTTFCFGQLPEPSPEHAVLKKEAGTWEATMKMWLGGPDQEPVVSTASETNEMLGEMWLVTDFTGSFGGQPFTGHGVYGYDPVKKKYIGTWVDSIMPSMSIMEGDYDKETGTMTYEMVGTGSDGKPQKSKLITVQKDKDSRMMTMLTEIEGKFIKTMTIEYKRKK